jgi:16S rRNA (adenine1518-N6/adenine1519-N6)-dimethyltransferase
LKEGKEIKEKRITEQPKKELGQNFLFDKNILKRIANSIKVDKEEEFLVIEIGSGYGTLTDLIAEKDFFKVISIEKDEDLFRILEKKEGDKKIIYLKKDALQIN